MQQKSLRRLQIVVGYFPTFSSSLLNQSFRCTPLMRHGICYLFIMFTQVVFCGKERLETIKILFCSREFCLRGG